LCYFFYGKPCRLLYCEDFFELSGLSLCFPPSSLASNTFRLYRDNPCRIIDSALNDIIRDNPCRIIDSALTDIIRDNPCRIIDSALTDIIRDSKRANAPGVFFYADIA